MKSIEKRSKQAFWSIVILLLLINFIGQLVFGERNFLCHMLQATPGKEVHPISIYCFGFVLLLTYFSLGVAAFEIIVWIDETCKGAFSRRFGPLGLDDLFALILLWPILLPLITLSVAF